MSHPDPLVGAWLRFLALAERRGVDTTQRIPLPLADLVGVIGDSLGVRP